MPHAKLKCKPDNSTRKSLPPLTVYYTSIRGLTGNYTDLETFMLENNPNIFALCETNLHYMHGLCVYVKGNLPILEDENESYVFLFGSSAFYYLHIFLVTFAIFVILFCG